MSPDSSRLSSTERCGEEPAQKRRRIAVACNSCRNRKSRCDGARPACSFCAEVGIECFYEQPAKVPQAKLPIGYDLRLKAIEDTLQQLVQRREEHEEPLILRTHNADSALRGDTYQECTLPAHETTEIHDASDERVDGLAAVNGRESGVVYFGPSSNVAFLQSISRATAASLKSIATKQRLGQDNTHEFLTSPQSPVVSTAPSPPVTTPTSDSLLILPTESRARHLMKLYFQNTGSLFPFISERKVLASYQHWKDRRFSGIPRSLLCLFNAIFAFATYMSAKPGEVVSKKAVESDTFFNRALGLSALSYQQTSDIETIQYLLLLSQYCQNTERPEVTWSLHGLAVQAAMRLGLHSQSRMNRFRGLEREVRKRLWFGCFILDRTLSMTLGRPPTIQDNHMNLELPLDISLDQLEAQTTIVDGVGMSNTTSFFIATIQLYQVLGSIITKMYGQNMDEENGELTLETIREILSIEDKLRHWKNSLPESLLLRPWEDMETDPWTLRQRCPVYARLSVVAQLRYLNIRILLHRPVLQYFLRRRLFHVADQVEGTDSLVEIIWKSSIAICQTSAIEIINIVHRLSKSMDLLGARWFSIYYTFNAALIIYCCFLLEISRETRPSPSITFDHSPIELVPDLITKLKMASKATERLDSETPAARRVLGILKKLGNVCTLLSQRKDTQQGAKAMDGLTHYDLLSTTGTTDHTWESDPTHIGESLGTMIASNPEGPTSPVLNDTTEEATQGWNSAGIDLLSGVGDMDAEFLSMINF
ncbi:fungal-specific transcription factor domain-containing protein [Biscogniauxia marginata]|nr:fungal-specific transcription factor domain-containing protein [Biscogniauxia marginata]